MKKILFFIVVLLILIGFSFMDASGSSSSFADNVKTPIGTAVSIYTPTPEKIIKTRRPVGTAVRVYTPTQNKTLEISTLVGIIIQENTPTPTK